MYCISGRLLHRSRRAGRSCTMRTRPTSDGTDENRLFRQARPARSADLLRARRQAAQRRAARARRAPAGGGQGRRPRDRCAQGAWLGAGRKRAHAGIPRLPQDHRARLGQAAEHLGRGRAQRPSGALSRDLSEGAGRPRRLAPGRPRLPDRAAHLGRSARRQRIGGDGCRPRARRRAPRPMRSAGRPAITPTPTWPAASAS